MAKDKKDKKGAAQEPARPPEAARHSAKETPRLKARFRKEVAPALMKEFELKNPMAVPHLHKIVVNVVLPRVRDFRGVSTKSFDGRGNYTLGLHDQLIFPEIDYAKVDKLKGMNVTIVTTARSDAQGRALLRHLGMPFRAEESTSKM